MHIGPRRRDSAKDFDTVFAITEAVMGFVPNSMMIMARDPELLAALRRARSDNHCSPRPGASRLENTHHVHGKPLRWVPILCGALGQSCESSRRIYTQN